MTRLFLCEKPSQGRDIAKVLGANQRQDGALVGQDVVVTWCFGHMLEMSPPDAYGSHLRAWSLDTLPILPDEWRNEIKSDAAKQFKIIATLLKRCDEVVIATDADRQGQVIGQEVLDYCDYHGPTKRLWITALDEKSIRKALDNLLPGEAKVFLYHSGLARGRADWLVGMNLTRAFTLSGRQAGYNVLFPYGRVQTPVLRLVVDRDRLIENFVFVSYYDLEIELRADCGGKFKAKWSPADSPQYGDWEESGGCDNGRCLDEKIVNQVHKSLVGQSATVDELSQKHESTPPPLGYDLSTLQEEASARWGFSADKTLEIAQSLYEKHKVASYPRSDCQYLPESQFDEAEAVMEAINLSLPGLNSVVDQADLSIKSRTWNQRKVEESSHHGIMPTTQRCDPDQLSDDEKGIYGLLCLRFIAQFYPHHEFTTTRVYLTSDGECFEASGRMTKVAGWTKVVGYEGGAKSKKDDERSVVLPALEEGYSAPIVNTEVCARKTKPLPYYTEGTLIKEMKSVGRLVKDPALKKILRDTSGLGQVSTRAAIIKTLLARKLLQMRGKKSLYSSDMGRTLIDALPGEAKDPAMTALWEQSLDDIVKGRITMNDFLNHQISWIRAMLEKVQNNAIAFSGATVYPCPACQKPMRKIKDFWGCTRYPDCNYTLPDNKGKPGKPRKKSTAKPRKRYVDITAGGTCPECQKGTVEQKSFSKGNNKGRKFFGCSVRPCKYFQWCQ